jgi:putative transcriptional regulator
MGESNFMNESRRENSGQYAGLVLLALLLVPAPAVPATGPPADPVLLVATSKIPEGNFFQTVVLLIRHDREGAFGLILNRPSHISASRMVPGLKIRPKHDVELWQGGPVDPGSWFVLIRSSETLEGATQISENLQISSDHDLLRKLLRKKKYEGSFRVYSGYAGWASGQLESELMRGGWKVVEGGADAVFSADPTELWSRYWPGLRVAVGYMNRIPGS